MSSLRGIVAGIGLTLLLACPPAWAVLGGAPGGVKVDGLPLSVPTKFLPAPDYIVHELTAPDVVIREYVSPQGNVFAVSWSGRRSPDLPALFGTYFDQYEAASANRDKKRSRLRGVTHIETPDLIVETGGQMGAIWGKAYLPSQLPPGMTKEAIQ